MDEARQAGRPDSRNALLYIAAASLVGSSIYFATLSHWFFSDDFHWLETAVKSVSNPRLILTHRFFNYFRPVVNALFSVNYLVFGLSAFGYHLFNVILHLISGFLVGSLAYRIFHYRTLPAVFGTLIFAVNPAGSEAVIWVSGRTDLLSMLFFLAALNLAIWKPFGPITNRMVLYFTLLMAVFSKESAVVWPMILFVIEVGMMSYDKSDEIRNAGGILSNWLKQRADVFVVMAVLLIIQLWIQNQGGIFLESFGRPLGGGQWLINILGGSAFALLTPFECLFHSSSITLILFCFLGAIVGVMRIKRVQFGFCALVIAVVCIAPAALVPFQIVPDPWLTFRRFFYMPLLGTVVLWSGLLDQLTLKSNFRKKLVISVVCSFVVIGAGMKTLSIINSWYQLTRSRHEAILTVAKQLKAIPIDRKIGIAVPNANVRLEMFRLFIKRKVIVTRGIISESEINDWFVFDRGRLVSMESEKKNE